MMLTAYSAWRHKQIFTKINNVCVCMHLTDSIKYVDYTVLWICLSGHVYELFWSFVCTHDDQGADPLMFGSLFCLDKPAAYIKHNIAEGNTCWYQTNDNEH